MMGLCAREALLALGAEKVAANTVYYWPDWSTGMMRFLRQGGLQVVSHGNFVDLGAYPSQSALDLENVVVPERVIFDTTARLAEKTPDIDAYDISGVVCLARPGNALRRRIVHLESRLEALVGKPVVASDTARYWRVLKTLGVAPTGRRGQLLSTLQRNQGAGA